jgi:hypothetical protein
MPVSPERQRQLRLIKKHKDAANNGPAHISQAMISMHAALKAFESVNDIISVDSQPLLNPSELQLLSEAMGAVKSDRLRGLFQKLYQYHAM